METILENELTPTEVTNTTNPNPVVEEAIEEKKKSQIDLEKQTMKNSILLGNPFMYMKEYRAYEIDSIEDYYVKYKKETVTFGDIVRSVNYRKGKKKRLTKKIFEGWKNDYLVRMQKNLTDDVRKLGARPTIEQVHPLLSFFLLVILLLYLGIIFITFQRFIALPQFLKDVSEISFNGIVNTYIYLGVFCALGVLFILAYFLKFKYSRIAHSYKRAFDKNDKLLEASKNKILNEFTRKYKEAYKYYMRNIQKNDFYIPLGMDGIGAGERIEGFTNMVEKTMSLKDKYDKNQVALKILKYPVFIFIVLSILFIIGYVGYMYLTK